jgi:hypothetical protein
MKIEMTDHDLALCVAALDSAAKDLRQGIVSSHRLGLVRQDYMLEKTSAEMDDLRKRLNATLGQGVLK